MWTPQFSFLKLSTIGTEYNTECQTSINEGEYINWMQSTVYLFYSFKQKLS